MSAEDWPINDGLRMCSECAHLERIGTCALARKGALLWCGTPRDCRPMRDLPQRCPGFAEWRAT